jgi:hypothetical protein
MEGSYGRRRVFCIQTNETNITKLKFVTRNAFAPGLMVWAGVSYYATTSLTLIFINKEVNVGSKYYREEVLKPFSKTRCSASFFLEEKMI